MNGKGVGRRRGHAKAGRPAVSIPLCPPLTLPPPVHIPFFTLIHAFDRGSGRPLLHPVSRAHLYWSPPPPPPNTISRAPTCPVDQYGVAAAAAAVVSRGAPVPLFDLLHDKGSFTPTKFALFEY